MRIAVNLSQSRLDPFGFILALHESAGRNNWEFLLSAGHDASAVGEFDICIEKILSRCQVNQTAAVSLALEPTL